MLYIHKLLLSFIIRNMHIYICNSLVFNKRVNLSVDRNIVSMENVYLINFINKNMLKLKKYKIAQLCIKTVLMQNFTTYFPFWKFYEELVKCLWIYTHIFVIRLHY